MTRWSLLIVTKWYVINRTWILKMARVWFKIWVPSYEWHGWEIVYEWFHLLCWVWNRFGTVGLLTKCQKNWIIAIFSKLVGRQPLVFLKITLLHKRFLSFVMMLNVWNSKTQPMSNSIVCGEFCDLGPFTSLQNIENSCEEVLFLVYLQAGSLKISESNTSL